MDLWIVAAATGAGYVAKYWQNQSKDVDSLSQLSFGDSNLVSAQSSSHFLNKFVPKRFEDVFGNGRIEEFENEKLGVFGSHQDFKVLSTPNLTLKSLIDEESSKSNKMGNEIGILVCNSSGKTGSLRNRSTSKGKFSHGDAVKPLSFVEDFLVVHESSLSNKLPKESHFESVSKNGKGRERKSRSCSNLCEHFASEGQLSDTLTGQLSDSTIFGCQGAPDESSILYLGFFIGMIYSFISNKREVHKLKELLKQTQYLVQDLQEELEMKDSLKLKELSNDNCESYTYSNAFSEKTGDDSSPKHVMGYTVNFNAEELYEHKAEESSEAMSRIEAELEAELERLGLNINTEGTEIFPDDDKLDPEFEEDFAEGELRNEMISEQSCGWSKANEEASDSTIHSGNYCVSPRELSLRLHDVIQSRLEQRIKELENALQNNHRKLQLVDTEFSKLAANEELQFTSNESSPNTEDEILH